ncbi:hypothetical protein CHARACLAT_031637 [Characodon lateralis]|uniref:Uncharacterized protein n=1 Tax=Characodon lateralis TaxID=208331 RepID=A0ABU7CTN2_9TELE|nr:hypothetical protein [Characodon lateralis]
MKPKMFFRLTLDLHHHPHIRTFEPYFISSGWIIIPVDHFIHGNIYDIPAPTTIQTILVFSVFMFLFSIYLFFIISPDDFNEQHSDLTAGGGASSQNSSRLWVHWDPTGSVWSRERREERSWAELEI